MPKSFSTRTSARHPRRGRVAHWTAAVALLAARTATSMTTAQLASFSARMETGQFDSGQAVDLAELQRIRSLLSNDVVELNQLLQDQAPSTDLMADSAFQGPIGRRRALQALRQQGAADLQGMADFSVLDERFAASRLDPVTASASDQAAPAPAKTAPAAAVPAAPVVTAPADQSFWEKIKEDVGNASYMVLLLAIFGGVVLFCCTYFFFRWCCGDRQYDVGDTEADELHEVWVLQSESKPRK